MSRIGKKPITVPAGVEVKFDGHTVTVKGPKGTLTRKLNEEIDFKMEGNEIIVSRPNDEIKTAPARSEPYTVAQHDSRRNRRILQETGNPGRRLQCTDAGTNLKLALGFSHPVIVTPPEGITITTPSSVVIVVSGCDKEKVGQVAAEIRAWRQPEPYKGKGIRYSGEYVRRKAGKTGATK